MRSVLFIFLFYGVVAVWAQVNTFLGLSVQNDFLNYRGHGTDRYYTGGNQLDFFLYDSKARISHHHISLTQQLYTPADLQDSLLRPLDYPYAGLLFVSYRIQHRIGSSKTRWALSSSWGYSGRRSGAGRTQQLLHRVIGDEIPQGWQYIAENGFFWQGSFLAGQPIVRISNATVLVYQAVEWGGLFQRIRWGVQVLHNPMDWPMGSFLLFPEGKQGLSKKSLTLFLTPTITWVFKNRLLEWLPEINLVSFRQSRSINKQLIGLEFGLGYTTRNGNIQFVQYLQQPEFREAKSHAYGEITIRIPINFYKSQ